MPSMILLDNDVLFEIFFIVIEDARAYWTTRTKIPREPFIPRQYKGVPIPFLLGQVSRQWRKVAWEAPSLWSRLSLRFSLKSFPHQTVLLKEWLELVVDSHRPENAYATAILNSFIFPSLIHVMIELSPVDNYPMAAVRRLAGALERSSTTLRTLRIQNHTIRADDLIRFLLIPNPTLSHLTLLAKDGDAASTGKLLRYLDLSEALTSR
ncbi:hypothetical protein CPB83DRAFT_654439 [Crepidotus variabilis]|uniref:F-box domain-containing protein n=1 Tax=Crepidotus variabilis TaxID=179855 RepID=A0A9P6JKI5_9AGAR|nr:hypothetical protein CPB83DRAFT_654439 [Crepidotus variabilis]